MVVETHDTLILGAGVAGLACAQRLFERGMDVVILEATNRVGGRARTDYRLANGYPLELGAQMIHGRHVVTHDWVRALGLSTRPLHLMQRIRIVVNGRVATPPWMVLPFYPGFGVRAAWEGFREIPRELSKYGGSDQTLAQFLATRKLRPAAQALVELLHAHVYATDPEEIGIIGPAEEERVASEEFGYRHFQLREGYDALTLRRAFPLRDRIRLGHRVVAVRWSEAGVSVQLVAGDPPIAAEFRARYVVVTLPLGVLKGETSLFDPPLPVKKQAAISRIGFADAFALHLRFPSRPVLPRLGDFAMLWARGSTTFMRPLRGIPGTPEILTAFTVGHVARERARMDDQEITMATLEEFASSLPHRPKLDRVTGAVVERWPTHSTTRGGYSYLPPGATLELRRSLAEPVAGRLFFAGEATHAGGESATVHGAIETGYRAAGEVLNAVASSRSFAPSA